MFCTKCGYKNKENAKFCVNCGSALTTNNLFVNDNHEKNSNDSINIGSMNEIEYKNNVDLINKDSITNNDSVNEKESVNNEATIDKNVDNERKIFDESNTVSSNVLNNENFHQTIDKPIKNRKNKRIIFIAVFVVACVAVVALSFIFGKKSVSLLSEDDINLYLILNGGNGHARLQFDTANYRKSKFQEISSITDNLLDSDAFTQSLQCIVSNSEDLSNGDEAIVQCQYDKSLADQLKLRIKDNSYKIKISGLNDMQSFIPFDFIHVNYSSIEHTNSIDYEFKIDIVNDLAEELNLEYNIESVNLPIVEVSCTYDNDLLIENGFAIIDVDENVMFEDSKMIKKYIFDLETKNESEFSAIGSIRSKVNKLNIRENHSTQSNKTGIKLSTGDEYEFYDVYQDDEYIWYCIGDNKWVADTGEWLEVTYY